MQNLAKHLYRANTHISRVNPRFCLGVSTLRGQAITAPTIDRPSFKRSVSSLRRLLSYSIYLNISAERILHHRARDRSITPIVNTRIRIHVYHVCNLALTDSVFFSIFFFFFKCLERPNRDKISLLSFFFSSGLLNYLSTTGNGVHE